MQIIAFLSFTLAILPVASLEDASPLEVVGSAAKDVSSADQKRQSDQLVVIRGDSDPSGHGLLLLDDPPAFDTPVVAVDGGVRLVSDDDGGVDADGPAAGLVVGLPARTLLEPRQLPPLLDVYSDVPDRVGDTPLQVQTVIEAEPTSAEQPLDVPWVWDDTVCTPLLNRPPPPAGPLTSDQVTFALPLVIREGKRLKLKTRSGAVSPIHSDEAAAVFERLFWCITALIARVRDAEERSRLMRKLYEDYLLWMETDVIPVVNRTDLKKAYKWIKKKDDSQWVVPEKQYYTSARHSGTAHHRAGGSDGGGGGGGVSSATLIIVILVFILLVLLLLYCCIVKKKKIFNFWCFCVCERCKGNKKGGKCQEEECKPLTNQRDGGRECCGRGGGGGTAGGGGGVRGPGEPTKSYVYRSSSWSSNSSLQPPCASAERSGTNVPP